MRCTILTLFPEFFDSPLDAGLMGKARESGLIDVALVNPRAYTTDRHSTVDDRPYGGGPGMVMRVEPWEKALQGIEEPGRILMMAPKGRPFTQAMARELAQEESLTILCGRYEGFDARLEEIYPIEAVSMGDFVLNGGETAALAVLEAVSRLVPGFMGKEESGTEESFSAGLLEYPHYTRPEDYAGHVVPEVLRSGDHGRIAAWRKECSLRLTLSQRPDILPEAQLDEADMDFLRGLSRNRPGRNLYCALVHYPVVLKEKNSGATSLTNLDIHDIGRSSCTYGLGGFYVTTPLEDQRRLLDTLLRHWTLGPGSRSNPDRAEALGRIKGVDDVRAAIEDIARRTGQVPYVVGTSAKGAGNATPASVRAMLEERPVLLVFGTGHGLAPEVLEGCDAILRPLRWMDGYNHLSVRAAAAIIMDRLLGDCY
ncbi:tRNA (guanosine(37)-N1)-methyltransferase TrmD [Nitratidesulfovibrio vulgaris]|jgi:tRNA (guanine37-N1)-methyltransferase|uniref:tRNA (guanine-N(1)-)-methyltransferase n=2 Tax=Nitratidesulfovibrio vulgaris TaxID=881 RepID=TRMD_NITV2|nr:tRNA (guanosine(37)-N1)-methyltransferase TrmD [Nitratidesulfovibrio vulgaris]Q72DU3.1 RecName: Full=tRNA (guanine-N(1)-)-methyltransferase; AltName: Full=M1G-methyltransferase; AltName: Full=tRNA [GM37] methyltransferase [Nitratidesulfovibrio vulgaris str. Hildenborough]GEB81332.1 tRNA (guanine-N(1)-)-methyltransferase [Desulfovibrio desulfuricans]HBW14791.1 tRNA (guanosine(37)-N1)-methyltransferase TrmD [Desulfovibrio sp.]AAS95316.1 tRNA (guanine-N1)-methyltransferase [Nitratidesulfovibrio